MRNERLMQETPDDFYKRTYWDLTKDLVLVFKSDIELHTTGCFPEEYLTLHEAKIRIQLLQDELNKLKGL